MTRLRRPLMRRHLSFVALQPLEARRQRSPSCRRGYSLA